MMNESTKQPNDPFAVTASSEPPVVRKLHAVGRKLGTPVSGTFELTAGCNFNCRMCYIHDGGAMPDVSNELTAREWLSMGRQAFDAGTVFVLLTGGEPLLRPDFAEIYTGLKKLGLMVSVNTNGSLIRGDISDLFIKNPPMRLNISLYADNADGYLRVCGVDAYARVAENIRRMRDAGVQVKINISFNPGNADRCDALASFVKELGLQSQTSVYMYPPVRRAHAAAHPERLSPEDAARLRIRWETLCGKTEKLNASAELLSRLAGRECPETDLPAEGVRCRAGHTAYWIGAAGDMLMCGMIPLSGGRVTELGFGQCWQNVRALMKTVTMPSKCTACTLRPVCCVCPAACYAESGDFTKAPSYLCQMSEHMAHMLIQQPKEATGLEAE